MKVFIFSNFCVFTGEILLEQSVCRKCSRLCSFQALLSNLQDLYTECCCEELKHIKMSVAVLKFMFHNMARILLAQRGAAFQKTIFCKVRMAFFLNLRLNDYKHKTNLWIRKNLILVEQQNPHRKDWKITSMNIKSIIKKNKKKKKRLLINKKIKTCYLD